MQTYRNRKSGFTLVEILIVVIILGILAAIVIPQFTNASQDARRSGLASTVQTLRSQVALYKMQHQDVTPAVATFWDQLELFSNDAGATQATKDLATGYKYGPYMQSRPANPMVPDGNKYVVTATVGTPATDAGASAYFYDATSGKVWAQGKNDLNAWIIIGD